MSASWRGTTQRERELFDHTRPVDFHAVRPAFKQALADAGVELPAAPAPSGARDVKARVR